MASTAVERFTGRAEALGVEVIVSTFPEGTRTAADAARAVGCVVGAIVKSLLFLADDEPVLVLTSGANRVDETRVAEAVGAGGVRKADADEVRAVTGYAIGGTPPFGHDRAVATLIDPDLLGHATVWAAAGTPVSVFPIDPTRLVAVTGARTATIAAP